MRKRRWPIWSDLSAALSKSGISLSAKPHKAALEPGSADGKQLVGRSILYHWVDEGWIAGVIEKVNSDKSKVIDGDMVNFRVYYEFENDLSNHVLQLEKCTPDGPAHSWVLLEEPLPVPVPDTPPATDDALAGTPHLSTTHP